MKKIILMIIAMGILFFTGCTPRYNNGYGSYYYPRGHVYNTGEYYRQCDCDSGNCGYYRYMGPNLSCGADGMCLKDEDF